MCVGKGSTKVLQDIEEAARRSATKTRYKPLSHYGFGFEYMTKFGWKDGKGLGAKTNGRLVPIDGTNSVGRRQDGTLLDRNTQQYGLGYKSASEN